MIERDGSSPAISEAAVAAALDAIMVFEAECGGAGIPEVMIFEGYARAALEAALPHLTVPAPPPAPDGLVVTDAMVEAGFLASLRVEERQSCDNARYTDERKRISAENLENEIRGGHWRRETNADTRNRYERARATIEAAFATRPAHTRPAPAAPTETLDSVLAEYESDRM